MARFSGVALVGALAVTGVAQEAWACGGLFCDSGPTTMPVDQSGENILFIMDGQTVEAHIQIQYEGEAARFSWVIPLTAIPEFSVGSQLLFNELLRVSVPSYGMQQQADQCDPGFGAPLPGGAASNEFAGGSSSSSGGGQNGTQVVFSRTVGAFDVTVLRGGDAMEVMGWLNDNGYAQLPGTLPLLEGYTRENFLFAAVKLTGGAGVDEIHPLVLKYPGNVPCVPLKLTAVAATSDMGVRTFFLGNGRMVPRGYKHLEVNPLRIDWSNNAANYKEVLSNAANDPVAGGQAFVTEFAGPHNAQDRGFGSQLNISAFHSEFWDAEVFLNAAPTAVMGLLQQQGLASCQTWACNYSHPLMQGILNEFLPVPTGMTEEQFYSNLGGNQALIDMNAWSASGFSAALSSRIVVPARHARDLVLQHPYLTRMFTLISPEEMTQDPEFHERPELPQVVQTRLAVQTTHCDGTTSVALPDGREVWLGNSTQWPTWPASMPWAMTIKDIPQSGDIITLVDNTSAIDAQLSTFNRANGAPTTGCSHAGPVAGSTGWSGLMVLAGLLLAARRRR